jgi:hypothetical protein
MDVRQLSYDAFASVCCAVDMSLLLRKAVIL